MSRDIGNYIACGVLAALFILFLPFVLLLVVVLAAVQLLTGRKVIRMNRWYQRQAEPPAPEEPEREVRASEAIIDAEIVDLPDEPPQRIGDGETR